MPAPPFSHAAHARILTVPFMASPAADLNLTCGIRRAELGAGSEFSQLVRAEVVGGLTGGDSFAEPAVHSRRRSVDLALPQTTPSHLVPEDEEAGTKIWLNPLVPWRINFKGTTDGVDGDLSELILRSIELRGHIHRTCLLLPPPRGTVDILAAGTLVDLRFARPAFAAMEVIAKGHFRNFCIDGCRVDCGSDEINWRTHGYQSARNRFRILLEGEGSDLAFGKVW